MTRQIKLNGKWAEGAFAFALVDDEQFAFLNQWKWKATPPLGGGHRYAVRTARVDGKQVTLRMHRIVLGYAGKDDVDHINHNGMDNRRENLRVVSRSVNIRNAKPVLVTGICKTCGNEFSLIAKATGQSRREYCSLKCRPTHEKGREKASRLSWSAAETVSNVDVSAMDAVYGSLQKWIASHARVEAVSMEQLRKICSEASASTGSLSRIGRAMRMLGWRPINRSKTLRLWVRPGSQADLHARSKGRAKQVRS